MAFLVWLTSFSFWISVIILLALIYHWWKKPHPKFPPLIRGFPLIGVVPYLNDNYPEMIFKKWSLEMKKPVFAVRIGSEEIVVINSYEMAYETLFKQSAKLAGRPHLYVFDQLSHNYGIGLRDFGDSYKKLRSFVLRFLRKGFGSDKSGSAAALEFVIAEEVDHLITELEKNSGKSIDLKLFSFLTSLNVISRAVTNIHYNFDDPRIKKLADSVSYLFSENKEAAKLAQLNVFPSLRFLPSYRKVFDKAKKQFKFLSEGFIDILIEDHRNTFNPDYIRDIIDEFLYEQQLGAGKTDKDFHDKNLRQIALDLHAAGTDTTATTIAWIFLCYLHFPQYHDLINEEIDANFNPHENLTFEVRHKMPFTCAYLLEVMRFRPINTLTYRKTKQTVHASDYIIPKETPVLINFLGINNDAELWKNPEKFDPYRHINENGEYVHSNKIFPYGLGYRACPGENIAKRQVFFVFIKLLHNFKISAGPEALPSLDESFNNVIHSPLPYNVVLTKRSL